MLHIPSFLAPFRLDAARVEILSQFFLQTFGIEGYIVSRASYKAVTSDECRGKKLPTEWQADSMISNIISDFMSQRMQGVVGAGGEKPRATRLNFSNSVNSSLVQKNENRFHFLLYM
jgi:hypothetical protein